MAKSDIELLFGVAGGGSVSGASGQRIRSQLGSIIGEINKKPIEVEIKADAKKTFANWEKDVNALLGEKTKTVILSVKKIDSSAALADFKTDLQKIINSLSLEHGIDIRIKAKDIGDIGTDLKEVGVGAKDTAKDIDRLNAEIKELRTQAASITSAYKKVTNTSEANVNGVSVDQIKAKYLELQTQIEAMNRVGASSSNTHIAKVRELEAEMRSLLQVASKAETNFGPGSDANQKALTKVNNLLADIAKNQRDWTKARDGKSSAAYSSLESYASQLRSLSQQLTEGKINQADFAKSFGLISDGVTSARKQIRACGEATTSLTDKFKNLASKFGSWLTVSQVIMAAYRTMQDMLRNVVEIDTAMTELKKVTDATEATYDRFLTNAASRTRELGATLSDVINATADFARLGYGVEEASALADAAIVYKNVADGIDDIGTASESIISTMQAFGIETSDVMSVVDKFNEVSNNFAISSGGIGEALQRSASAMYSAGNTLDETIALVTAANTVVQNPESVGTTLKTVSMYLRAAKTEAEEAGESTDGMANSMSELREEILKLTGNQVDIQLDEENFKSTFQILKELSEVWDGLTDISQANILEMVGGKRNANVVSALLENFDIAKDALSTSLDSEGSAMAENEKYLDSIAGRIEKLKATFESLSVTLINNDLVKGIISIADAILQVTDALAGFAFNDMFSSLATLGAGGGIFAFFKNLD